MSRFDEEYVPAKELSQLIAKRAYKLLKEENSLPSWKKFDAGHKKTFYKVVAAVLNTQADRIERVSEPHQEFTTEVIVQDLRELASAL